MPVPTTLTDIARAVGVAPSTVQRALNGAPGVSEKRREEIRKIAQEMGYQRNAMATMLKSPNRAIAVILPEIGYYTGELWRGVRQCFNANAGFGFTVHEYTYKRTAEFMAEALEKAFAEHGTQLSGVLTMGIDYPRAREVCRKWNKANVPVIFVGTDDPEGKRLSCFCGNDTLAGQMAADILLLLPQTERLKILITGDFSIADQYQNMQGFESSIMRRASRYEILKYGDRADAATVRDTLVTYFQNQLDITAVYSTSARNTVAMCQAVEQAGMQGHFRLIGSDLFPESRQYLKDGVLQALVHKRPYSQAYNAAQSLIHYLVHGQTPESIYHCDPVVILRSNADYDD